MCGRPLDRKTNKQLIRKELRMTMHRIQGLKVPRLLFIALPLALVVCAVGEAGNPPPAPPAPQVTTSEVAIRELHDSADFTGRLEAVDSVAIRPRVGGYVESVHFTEGGRVEQGALLYRIDPRPFKAEVDRLAAERERALAQLKLAQSYRDRAERLLARNATSQEEFEQVAADATVAAAQVASIGAALRAAELNLSFTRVTAPIAGRVSRANVTAGNLVDASTVLTTLVSDEAVYAYFDVDEQTYLTHVQQANAAAHSVVHVGLINEHGYPHVARLDFVDNQVDPSHGTIRARAVLDNRDGLFTPGLFARMQLVTPTRYVAALVDDRAIGTDLGKRFGEGVVQYRPVETGRLVDGLRVVENGLAAGDVVVVNGLQRVRPGVTVAETRVAMGHDLPALAHVAADEAAAVNAAF
jgi:multidrug efflux system membrane fusion protein